MLQLRPLPPVLAEKVKELNEDPAQLERDVEDIRQWITNDPELHRIPSDQFIVNWLRACEYDKERFKKKYKPNVKARRALEIFRNRNIHHEKFQEILRQGSIVSIKNLNENDPTIIIYRPKTFNVDLYNLEEFAKPYTTLYDLLINNDDNYILCGQVAVMDCSDVGFRLAMHLKWKLLMKLLTYAQKTSPFKIAAVHVVNLPYVLRILFNLTVKFISHKTIGKIHLHSGFESLCEYIPQRLLPKDYGGDAPSIKELMDKQIQLVLENEQLFKEMDDIFTEQIK